jgi:signal peptidase I
MESAKNFIKETAKIAVISFIIVLPIRIFIAQPFVVSGASMSTTFQDGNYLIVDELSYRFEKPQRGDVIIFKVPPEALALQNYNANQTVYYIKRIIGLPGETIEIDGDQVKIFNKDNPNGFILNEPYVYIDKSVPSIFSQVKETKTLGPNEYFVMGDNRHNSSDSRVWGILDGNNIKGRAIFRLFPLTETGTFPGKYTF